MKRITTFNGWLLSKINRYLMAKEGCELEKTVYTSTGAKTILRDAFGYRYKITIEMLGRAQTELQPTDLQRYTNETEYRA